MASTADQIVVRTAGPADLPAILELTCAVFGEKAREGLVGGIYRDSTHRLDQSLIAEVGGLIASYVRVVDRSLRDGEAVLRLGGIASVATLPAYRGLGLSTALLRAAIDHMHAAGYHLSLLFTDIQPFYRRLGWVPFPESATHLAVPSTAPTLAGAGNVVRPFALDRDLEAVERIYDEYNRRLTGPFLRDHRAWTDGRAAARGIMPTLVAERRGEVVAYVTLRARGDRLMVSEAGCRDGAVDAFRPLAAAVAGRATADGAAAIEARLPRRHGLIPALEALSDQPSETVARQHAMLRLIDLAGLVQAALPELARRVARRRPRAAPPYSLALRVGGESVRFTLGPRGLAVDGRPADRTLDLPAALFFRLFLGDRPVSLLEEELALLGIRLSTDERDLLDALFPPRDPVFWYVDHF